MRQSLSFRASSLAKRKRQAEHDSRGRSSELYREAALNREKRVRWGGREKAPGRFNCIFKESRRKPGTPRSGEDPPRTLTVLGV